MRRASIPATYKQRIMAPGWSSNFSMAFRVFMVTVVFTGFGDRRFLGFSKNGGSNMGHDMHSGMPCP